MYSSWLCVVLIMRVTAEVELMEDYHEKVGIPLAKWIKKTEDKIHARPVSGRRVVGGGVAPQKLYPYLGGLLAKVPTKKTPSACGSTLITANRLVTAAHCWRSQTFQTEEFTVVLGSEFLFTGGTRIVTKQILLHPDYNVATREHNVAMIYLPTYVTFSETIKPAILPHDGQNTTYEGEWVLAAGYGRTSENVSTSVNSVISHVKLQVISTLQCHQVYYQVESVESCHICTNGTGGVGVCQGDSGGPLVSIEQGQPILVGITLFAHSKGCERGYPSVFARVASYYNFIMDHL